MDNLLPPRVLIESNTVGLNESVPLTSLFTVFDDFEGFSGITQFQISDNSDGGGFFTLGGSILTPTSGFFHPVPANQIGNVRYVGGNSIGTESISIRVFDGAFFSDTATGLITSGNARPVVTAEDVVVTAGSRTSLADLIQYSDAENNPDRFYFIVDRRINGGGLVTEDDTPNPEANFLRVSGFQLANTDYLAPLAGGESETISIRAFDGFSFSETTDFTITTSIAPTIINNGQQSVTTNQRRLASELFSLDPDAEAASPAQSFFFVDRRINANGGFFEFQGVRQTSGEFFFVRADQLDELFYVGASQGADIENIGIVGFNGFELGEVQDIAVQTQPSPVIATPTQTVRAGHFLNFATGGTANVSGTIPESDEPIFDFLDSGANIIEYLFVDRRTNGGSFIFQGSEVPSGQFFRVAGDELDQLEYAGAQTGPLSEQIGVLVNTNFVWSQLPDFTINTIPNATAPEITVPSITVRPSSRLPLVSLFSFTDAEGDSLNTVTLFDTATDVVADPVNGIAAVSTGFFEINGVRQPAETSIVVPFDQISTVNYVSSPTSDFSEDIQISVNDFLNDSEVATATISTLALPAIQSNANDISLDTIERVLVSSLVAQIDNSVLTRYQVFDENSSLGSGRFELDGVALQDGIVHDLPAAEYARLVFTGAVVDNGRQLDPIIVRANDGTGFSEWERVNVNTDPVGIAALDSGAVATDNLITFSFADGGNQGDPTTQPLGARVPFYYQEGDDEFAAGEDNTLLSLSPEQRAAYREVLEFYERVIDVEFVELPYNAATTTAEMVVGAFPIPGFSGQGQFPDGDSVGNPGSDVFFNTLNLDFDPNTPTTVDSGDEFRFSAFQLVAFTFGINPPFAGDTPLSIFNNFQYLTIAANQRDSVFNRFEEYPTAPASPALFDIQQLQLLYGANTDFNSGDNQYGNFFSGSDPHFTDNDTQNQTTLWDGGGNDTLNYTLHVADETIDLRQGTFSSINGVPQSLRISYDTIIENARGGSGDDNLRGNETRNFLIANGGDDVLRGGGDNDVLRGGAGDDTYIWSLGDGRDLVQELGEDGLDTLQVFDPSGALTSLQDDLTFRRFGNDLRIDFTFNQGSGQGTVTIDDFGDEVSRVEFLQIHNSAGTQIGETIDLQSIFDQATTLAQRFSVGTELATTLPVEDGANDQNAFIALAVS